MRATSAGASDVSDGPPDAPVRESTGSSVNSEHLSALRAKVYGALVDKHVLLVRVAVCVCVPAPNGAVGLQVMDNCEEVIELGFRRGETIALQRVLTPRAAQRCGSCWRCFPRPAFF
jgi:hypothetical protein